ncbi:hypothetical protein [Amycolatopsis benzoatilytica]|uniref:hypothetical protein n=1 Tax=Amycolatopsis benzoatilytica TaxID=346045 RepID=UPI0012B6AC4D|nr:hypothetical protein [Amycolatopsis benzoatilytica]
MPITTDFWAATAQIIPTLLIAFAVAEKSAKLTRAPREGRRIVTAVMLQLSLALAAVAEFLALGGLLGIGGPGTARVVIIAIGVVSSWTIFVVAMWAALKFVPEQAESEAAMDRLEAKLDRELAETATRSAEIWTGIKYTAVLIAEFLSLTGQLLLGILVWLAPTGASIWLACSI